MPRQAKRGKLLRFARGRVSWRPPDTEVLHEMFEARADERCGEAAVVADRTTTSYADLDRHANRIARHLWGQGVRRGSRVGVLLRRSVDAYATILAILKAGAAYVPIDPCGSAARTAFVLEDSDAAALVTTTEFPQHHAGFGGPVLRLDSDRATIEAECPARLPRDAVRVGPRDLCYVMYTSDVSDQRGVMIEHRSACHLARTGGHIFGVRPWDRVYQGSPLSRDASVQEIWLAFEAGATLVAPTPAMERGGRHFATRLARARITVLSCTPSLLEKLAADIPSLRVLILGGERCPGQLAGRWTRADRLVVNTYGRTETTGMATYAELLPGKPVTVGRPVPGYRVYVLDDQLRLARCGSIGEICIGGIGVARGYMGLFAETHARFVPDPFAPAGDGARIHLTGDLGRIDPSGNLEVHGRLGSEAWSRHGSRS